MKPTSSIIGRKLHLTNNQPPSYWQRDVRRSLVAGLICLSLCFGFMSPAVSAKVKKKAVKAKVIKPAVSNIQFRKRPASAATAKNTIPVSIDIIGNGFGKTSLDSIEVILTNTESFAQRFAEVKKVTDTHIFARADVPASEDGPTHFNIELEISDEPIPTPDDEFEIPLQKVSQPEARSIEVVLEAFNNPQNPTLHSLLLTPKEDDETFGTSPNEAKVDILPPGATNVTIRPASSSEKMLVTFEAPEDFEAKDVLVTVNDSGSRTSEPSKNRRSKQAADGTVKITRVDILSLQRRDGFGRLKIEGEGFGEDYARPTQNGDLELLCDPANRSYHVDERDDTRKKNKRVDTSTLCPDPFVNRNKDWRGQIEESLNVQLVPRNTDLRVERTLIIYADDKVIDVYFEFSHWQQFSEPFRLESVSVSVTRVEPASPQQTGSATGTAATSTPKFKTYLASHDIGPPRDTNLEYGYTVLDQKDASQLFGSGVGEHFYVIQLSLINKGDKKVIVPLSSIQAEIEWAYGDDTAQLFYDEGPSTLRPLSLSDISSYFDAYQKTKGKKAKLFNFLDGLVTLGAAMVPVWGRSIERPVAIMSGGFIPGLRKSLGDLSSQQLLNLTSRSWEGVEEVPSNSGIEKYVYVQRSDQSYTGSSGPKINKQIKSIAGLEVSGFIVNDSSGASAVKRQ